MWSAVSDERTGLPFKIAAGPRQCSYSWVRVPRDSWPYFTVSDSRLPQTGAQVPVFISPRNRVTRLYPQVLGSLSVAFTTRKAMVEVIRTLLHTLEGPSAMPWHINSRRTEYKTWHSRLLKNLLYKYGYSTEVNRFTKCTFLFPSYHCP
jgi:hypothetical protein